MSLSGELKYTMNTLCTRQAETLSLLEHGKMPGYTGHLPGKTWVVGQRKAAAALHAAEARTSRSSTLKSSWSGLSLVDRRPEQRTFNKNYMYAENNTSTFFMKFPNGKEVDHRKL